MDSDRLSKIPTDNNGEPILAMVRIAANKEKVVPDGYKQLIPSKEISVSSLLNSHLPTIFPPANILPVAESCFASKPPNWTRDQLMSFRVPSQDWLKALDVSMTDGWAKGANSVRHPGNGKIHFPLWVGTFWMELTEAIKEQQKWR